MTEMDLVDGLLMGSPYLHLHSPDLALSIGAGSPCDGSSPLSEMAVAVRVAEAHITVVLGSLYEVLSRCDLVVPSRCC